MLFFFYTAVAAKEKPPINVVGDVGGRIAIVVVREDFPALQRMIDIEYLPCPTSTG